MAGKKGIGEASDNKNLSKAKKPSMGYKHNRGTKRGKSRY